MFTIFPLLLVILWLLDFFGTHFLRGYAHILLVVAAVLVLIGISRKVME